MKQLTQSLFSLMFIATRAIAKIRTNKSTEVVGDGYKDPLKSVIKLSAQFKEPLLAQFRV